MTEEILNRLEECYDKGISPCESFDCGELCRLMEHDSEEVRQWLAKALVNHLDAEDAVSILSKLTRDRDEITRIEAVDSISQFCTQESFDTLCDVLMDEEELVRAYGALGVGCVGKFINKTKAENLLLDRISKEREEYVQLYILAGLYCLGQRERLKPIIQLFDSENYQIQCALLRILDDVIHPEDRNRFEKFVASLEPEHYPVSVADVIRSVATQKVCNKQTSNTEC